MAAPGGRGDLDGRHGEVSEPPNAEGPKSVTSTNYLVSWTQLSTSAKEPIPNWTQELQKLRRLPDSSVEKHTAIAALCQNFYSTAELLGKIIIREIGLNSKRTINPTRIGGEAGGEKYVVQNIIFKFALKNELYENDEVAMKASAHELKGYSAFISKCSSNLNFALLCTIDYLGYRLVATSQLPIDKDKGTLVYGSNDSGKSCKDGQVAHKLLHDVTSNLNLCNHEVGTAKWKVLIAGPIDLEVHQSSEGEHFVLDFARMFPPEAQYSLTKLLRREVVFSFSKPLSSDAFSSFSKLADDNELHNKNVKEAVHWMSETKLPEAVKELQAWMSRLSRHVSYPVGDVQYATTILHRHGINARHFGHVLSKVPPTDSNLCKLLLVQIYSRVAKIDFRTKLRLLVKEYPYDQRRWRVEVEQFANSWLSGSIKLFDPTLVQQINSKFSSFAIESWQSFLEKHLHYFHEMVVDVVFHAVGVQLSIARHQLSTVTEFDVMDFSAVVSGAGLLQYSEACALVHRSKAIDIDKDHAFAIRLMEKALESFSSFVDRSGGVPNPSLLIDIVKTLSGDSLREVENALGILYEVPLSAFTSNSRNAAFVALELLFSTTTLPKGVDADAVLLLWHVVLLQRKELHLKALERLRQAYEVAQGTTEVLAKVLVCIGAAVEGIPQPRDGKTACQQYWDKLLGFVRELTKGCKLADGADFNFVSLEEYEKAQLACAIYEKAYQLWPSKLLAKNYVARIHSILSGEKRVYSAYRVDKFGQHQYTTQEQRNRTQFRMIVKP